MKFDSLGLPQDNGASDLQDSARLAGIMTVFKWPQKIPLTSYIMVSSGGYSYVRHPKEYIYNFSRDQYLCLIAGLKVAGHYGFVNRKYVDGIDIMSPTVSGHEQRCKGLEATKFQNACLVGDILIHALFTPIGEPNQLLCMMKIAGPKYVTIWKALNPFWRRSIRRYWAESYRNEPELSAHIIKDVEENK